MPVLVTLSTTLRACVADYNPATGLTVEWNGPVSAGELAEKIGLPLREIKIVMRNGRHAGLEETIADGDRVGYFPAVGGG